MNNGVNIPNHGNAILHAGGRISLELSYTYTLRRTKITAGTESSSGAANDDDDDDLHSNNLSNWIALEDKVFGKYYFKSHYRNRANPLCELQIFAKMLKYSDSHT